MRNKILETLRSKILEKLEVLHILSPLINFIKGKVLGARIAASRAFRAPQTSRIAGKRPELLRIAYELPPELP